MSKLSWSITYQVTTEESVEQGDWAETGWIDEAGTEWALQDQNGRHEEVLDRAWSGGFSRTSSLSDLMKDVYDYDCRFRSDGNGWLESRDNGSSYPCKEYNLHIQGVTKATKERIFHLAENL